MINSTLSKIQGGLIVSCQALPEEPLHGSHIMSRMAYAAYLGGACGIRANTVPDILSIKDAVDLPVIGIIKTVYEDSEVYITPGRQQVEELVNAGCEIIAVDATDRRRPGGITLDEFFTPLRKQYPSQLFMADCATVREAVHAQEIGFDLAGTTLAGYTSYTAGTKLPDFRMIEQMADGIQIPIIAEGGIICPGQVTQALDCGAFAVVVGGAITRPAEITKRFAEGTRKAK